MLSPAARPGPRIGRAFGCLVMLAALAGCSLPVGPGRASTAQQLAPLLPTDAILMGEQHDASDHQRVEREVVQQLVDLKVLAALALEMSEQGHSTGKLSKDASEDDVRAALDWDNKGWPWAAYGPAVMVAVRAGVPVLGANLPHDQKTIAMKNSQLDMLLTGPALKAQQQRIRIGHCEMLPENQITPMTRIQIARDIAMAQTLTGAAVPGKTVLLLAGAGHVDRKLGVPQHLPASFGTKSIGFLPATAQAVAEPPANVDAIWPARPAPDKDYCAEFRARKT